MDLVLEGELHRILDPLVAAPIPAFRVREPVGLIGKLLSGAAAAFGFKVLTGIAAVAAAATVAGAVTETVITQSANPSVWGRQIQQQVSTCKDQLGSTHGIGGCVAALTKGGVPSPTAVHALPVPAAVGGRNQRDGGTHPGGRKGPRPRAQFQPPQHPRWGGSQALAGGLKRP